MSKKYKSHYPNWYEKINCPLCKSDTFYYCSWREDIGTVEQHGDCERCGFFIEQAYSPTVQGIRDIFRGYKGASGIYYAKNRRKHKRIRRKIDTKGIEINAPGCWMF